MPGFFKIEYEVRDSGPCMVTCVCARCCGMVLPGEAPLEVRRHLLVRLHVWCKFLDLVVSVC